MKCQQLICSFRHSFLKVPTLNKNKSFFHLYKYLVEYFPCKALVFCIIKWQLEWSTYLKLITSTHKACHSTVPKTGIHGSNSDIGSTKFYISCHNFNLIFFLTAGFCFVKCPIWRHLLKVILPTMI
jgi:hypothetical protein